MQTQTQTAALTTAEQPDTGIPRQKSYGSLFNFSLDTTQPSPGRVRTPRKMAQVNGIAKEQRERESTPVDTNIVPPGRVISTSMMRQAALEQVPSPDSAQWSAIGHASTGKSGRVIERLQQEIDRLNRDKQLLKLRHEEAERATETLHTQYLYLQDRNSNYESSHEANVRQLQRKERQVEDLREEVQKEKDKTARAEDALRSAAISEDEWREQAHQAKAVAQQKETEYDAIVSCRNMDNDRHQSGLNRIKACLEDLLKKRDEDLEKQKRIEIIAEQRKQEIDQLDALNKKLQANFNTYRADIDAAIDSLRAAAQDNDTAVQDKLTEMKRVTGEMRWLMNVETVLNGRQMPPRPDGSAIEPYPLDAPSDSSPSSSNKLSNSDTQTTPSAPPSPSKKLSLDFRRHKRKGSNKSGK